MIEPTLKSLLDQQLPAREIRLYIPRSYRRFPEWAGDLPNVPAGIKIYRCDVDFGPATKVLPAAKDLMEEDVDILFCDDDKLYDPSWHGRFKAEAKERPGCCIVEVGETFPDIAESHRPPNRLPRGRRIAKDWRYRLIRILSLALYKPNVYRISGYVDQISGYAGVLVRPEWFDDEAFDIPDHLWMVDDPWLSGHLERLGIPIWLNGRGRIPKYSNAGRISALLDLVEDGNDRVASDLAAIGYMRRRYGIWQKGGSVETDFRRMTGSMIALAQGRSS